jgi:hypothetical protein
MRNYPVCRFWLDTIHVLGQRIGDNTTQFLDFYKSRGLFARTFRNINFRYLTAVDAELVDIPSTVSVGQQPNLPTCAELMQNYPNPFNPSTTIRYGLPVRSHVTLTVFNALGQSVSTLMNGEQEAGYHEIQFKATNLSSGVYFYRIEAGSFVQTRKLLLVR